jgi:hypothetical protein
MNLKGYIKIDIFKKIVVENKKNNEPQTRRNRTFR